MATDTRGTSFGVAAQSGGMKRDRNDGGDSESQGDGVKKPKASGEYLALAAGLKSSLHGIVYQLKLSTLFLYRGLQQNYGVKLATEMVAAEKFDDVVFYYTNEYKEKMIRFLQAKHKQDETKTISYSDLLSEAETADFSLKKYFVSYRKIKKNPEFEGYKLKDFVICTNIDFHENVRAGFEPITGEDDILYFKNCSKEFKRLKLNVSKFDGIEELRSILLRSSEVFRLARILAICVCDEKPLELRGDLLKVYHGALGEKVIRRISRQNVGQFREEFTDFGKSPELENFRKAKMKLTLVKISNSFGKKNKSVKEGQLTMKPHLPDDCIDATEISNFFDDLVFAVNQPSEIQLGDIIKNEIGEDFNLIDSEMMASQLQGYMLTWMKEIKDETAPFLTTEDRKKFFNEIKQKIYKLQMISPTLILQDKVGKFKISFMEKLTELQEFLRSTGEYVCICNLVCTHDTIFGSIKILQILKELDAYQREDSYIFMRIQAILCLEDRVIETFNSTTTNLLVIECNFQEDIRRLYTLYTKLKNVILGENKNKKVILITLENDDLAGWFKDDGDCSYTEIEDVKNSFTDLDKKSQGKILMKKNNVIFQGKETNVSAVVDGESTHLLSGDVLLMLIKNEKVEISKAPIDSTYNEVEDYFIDRTFFRKVIIKTDFHKHGNFFIVDDKRPDIPSINNSSHEDIVSISDTSDAFEELCGELNQHNIHWLMKEDDQFIWRRTRGDLKELYKFVDDSENSIDMTDNAFFSIIPNRITDIPDKMVLIAAEPGMGKSVILSHLALKTQSISPSLWIIRCNLNDYTKFFFEMSENVTKINMLEAMKFLCEIANFRNFKYSEEDEQTKNKIHRALAGENIEIHSTGTMKGLSLLEIKLFVHFFHHGRVLLLFDGFDEISPDYNDLVIKLLTFFKDTKVNKVWLTTRPYNIKKKLEKECSTFSYELKPFLEKEKSDFLNKFWRKKLKLEEFNEERANVFIRELLNQLSKFTNAQKVEFLNTPLQIYMIATLFSKNFEEFYSSGSGEPSLDSEHILDNIDLVTDLYEAFLNENFEIQERKLHRDYDHYRSQPTVKRKIERKRAEFMEEHEILAVYSIFKADQFKKNLPEQEWNIKKLVEDVREAEMKTGIIIRIVDHKPQFIHHTFAEYLVASYIWRKFVSIQFNDFKEKFITSIITDILIKDAKIQVSHFLQLIAKKKVISLDDFSEWKTKMDFLFEELANQIEKTSLPENEHDAVLVQDYFEGYRPFLNDHQVAECQIAQKMINTIAPNKNNFQCIKFLLGIIEFSWQKRDEKLYFSAINQNQLLELLCICAEMGYTKFVQRLMENLSTEDFKFHLSQVIWCSTPLWIAAKKHHLDIMKLLVENSSYRTAWKDRDGATLIERGLSHFRFDVLKYCLEFSILDCGPCRNFDNEKKELELPIYGALRKHAPPEVIKLFIENTDANHVNKFIHHINKLPMCDIMLSKMLTYDRPIEMIKHAIKKGFHCSFCMNICFIDLYITCFEAPVFRLTDPRQLSKLDSLFDEIKFSNLFSTIELLLKSGVGYSYSDKRLPIRLISTYELVLEIYHVHKFLIKVYNLHKQKLGKNCDLRQIILKSFVSHIRFCGFDGVKIIIDPDKILISPRYTDELSTLSLLARNAICEIIRRVIASSNCMEGFKLAINSNDQIILSSEPRETLTETYPQVMADPFPDQVMTELFFEHYKNGDGNLVKMALDKLSGFQILKKDGELTIEEVFSDYSRLIFKNEIFENFEDKTDHMNLLIVDIEGKKRPNKSLNKLATKLLCGVLLLHFRQGYEIADAVTEISEEALRFENRINKLLEMKQNLGCEEDLILLDYDNVLEILDLKHIDCGNEDLQYLIRERKSYPLIWDRLIGIYAALNYVGQKNLMVVFEQMLMYSDQSKNIFELYEQLHKSYECLIFAVRFNIRDFVSYVLENVKQDFVKSVINGLDRVFCSPLHCAAFYGRVEITSILLQNGANSNLKLCNNAEKIKYFPQAVEKMKKNPFLPNNFINWTPLYFAVLNNHREIVRELINYGAVVNPVLDHHSQDGYTPLHVSALTCGRLEIPRLLLENGAIYNVQNKEGETALDLATDGSDIHNLLYRINRIFKSVENNEKDVVNSLFEATNVDWKAMLKARNTDGKTILNVARDNRQKDILRLLMEKLKSVT